MPTKFSTLDITEQSSHYLLTNNLSITHPISIKNSLNLPVNIKDLQCYVAEYFVYKRIYRTMIKKLSLLFYFYLV